MAEPLHFTDDNFKAEVIDSSLPVLVDFWAAWCGPCRAIAPIIEELANEYDGQAKIGKVDIDNNQRVAMEFGIRSIPTLLVFHKGKVVETLVGAVPKAKIESVLRPYVAA